MNWSPCPIKWSPRMVESNDEHKSGWMSPTWNPSRFVVIQWKAFAKSFAGVVVVGVLRQYSYQRWWLSELVTPGGTAIPGMTSLKDGDLQHSSALAQHSSALIDAGVIFVYLKYLGHFSIREVYFLLYRLKWGCTWLEMKNHLIVFKFSKSKDDIVWITAKMFFIFFGLFYRNSIHNIWSAISRSLLINMLGGLNYIR